MAKNSLPRLARGVIFLLRHLLLSDQVLRHQPLSIGFRASRVLPVSFTQIAMQVLLSNKVIHIIDTTFQRGKIAFNCVRGDARSVLEPDVLFGPVIHVIVLAAQ